MAAAQSIQRKRYRRIDPRCMQRGFTLSELAIVSIVIALLLGGLLLSFAAQTDIQRANSTQRTLELAQEALVGFVILNGRLPCPATGTAGSGVEQVANSICLVRNGFFPARSLGLSPMDSQGYLIDSYGNRIGYSVSNEDAFTTTTTSSQLKARSSAGTLSTLSPDLRICSTASGLVNGGVQSSASCAGSAATLSDSAVVAIYSLGPNAGTTGSPDSPVLSTDERANYTADRVLVWHERNNTPGSEFDDLLVWLPKSVLIAKLSAAGAL